MIPDPRATPLLTVDQVVALTGLGERAVRAGIAAGDLPGVRVGRLQRVATAPLLALLGLQSTPDSSEAGPATGPAIALTAHDDMESTHAHENVPSVARLHQRRAG